MNFIVLNTSDDILFNMNGIYSNICFKNYITLVNIVTNLSRILDFSFTWFRSNIHRDRVFEHMNTEIKELPLWRVLLIYVFEIKKTDHKFSLSAAHSYQTLFLIVHISNRRDENLFQFWFKNTSLVPEITGILDLIRLALLASSLTLKPWKFIAFTYPNAT